MIEIIDAVPGYKTNGGWKIGCPSNGTMGADISFRVIGSKPIRSICFFVVAIDSNENIITPMENSRHVKQYGMVLAKGSLEQFEEYNIVNQELWYSSPRTPIEDIAIFGVEIEYTDGTTHTMDWEECEEQQIRSHEAQKKQLQQTNNTYSVSSQQKGGCYIATCVYGSYDCPEVWTLRRYRDFTLAKSMVGRQFIRIYYAISPKLVKRFGHRNWFKKIVSAFSIEW